MTTPLWCLLAFAAWTWALVVFGIAGVRVFKVLAGQAAANAFPADEPHGAPAYRRLMRAHMNCVETLPLFAVVVLVAHVAGVHSPAIDTAAQVIFAGRIGQTLAHVSSGRSIAVHVRFTFFAAQIIGLAWIAVTIAQSA